MARTFYHAVFGTLLMCLVAAADPAVPSFNLIPNQTPSAVSGLPGSIVGWGFSLTNNDPVDFLLVSNSFFCATGQDPLFTTCAPGLGASTYTDFIASNSTLLGPGENASQTFDGVSQGVGAYTIDSLALPGQTDNGSITLLYNFFTANPFDPNSNAMLDGGTNEISADALVTVTGAASVPEPAYAPVVCMIFAVMIAIWWRKRRAIA